MAENKLKLQNFCSAFLIIPDILESQEEKIEKILTLLNQAIKSGNCIYFTGAGRSGDVSSAAARRFMQLKRGMKVFCIPGGVAQSFVRGDILIAISSSGSTELTKTQVAQAKHAGATIISIISRELSPIANNSDVFIVLPIKPKENNQPNDFPLNTFFEISALMFLDFLITQLMKKLGVTEAEMGRLHPYY